MVTSRMSSLAIMAAAVALGTAAASAPRIWDTDWDTGSAGKSREPAPAGGRKYKPNGKREVERRKRRQTPLSCAMSYILRSWSCLNPRCAAEFTASEACPACPQCGCVRVNWIPGGGHVGGTAKAADAELRALIDVFKLPDINSAERGRGAKKIAPQPVVDRHSGPMVNFGTGFSAPIAPGAGAMCVPSSQAVDFKVKAGIGRAHTAGKLGLPSVQSATSFDASHRPPR
jgi:hypothetical protein